MGISGKADAVEFHYMENGNLQKIIPVEYKRGKRKEEKCDALQLCAQAICLEEMTGESIVKGYLFYGKERRRTEILFSDQLREMTESIVLNIHSLYKSESTPPKAEYISRCKSCSLLEYCKPKTVGNKKSANLFFQKVLNEVKTR